MSLDMILLRLCADRGKFERLVPNAPRDGLDELTILILDALRAYYREFPDTKTLPHDVFVAWAIEFKWKALPDDKKSLLKLQLREMREPVPPEAEAGMVEKLLELELATTAVSRIMQWNGGGEFSLRDELGTLAESITDRMDRKARLPLVTETPEQLMAMDENNTGLKWRADSGLANSMRAARGGDFGIVAFRVDQGKSSWLSDCTSHWITQLDEVWPGENRNGVWLVNEGPGKRIKQRWFQSLLRATTPEMVGWARDGSLRSRIESAMGCDIDRMKFFDIHEFTSGDVLALLKQTKPGFVVFDMLDNITFTGGTLNGGMRTDQLLEGMYGAVRNWAVKQDFVGLAASQISFEGEGQQFPPQSALANSKTAKQGTADFILMGGSLLDPAMNKFRYLSLPKNKLSLPGGRRDPRVEVMFDAERARFYTQD